jgi:hypothetical protein
MAIERGVGFMSTRKRPHSKAFPAIYLGPHYPSHYPTPPSAPVAKLPATRANSELGPPLSIREAAKLIGLSPWTIRQRLIPMGLPHFRSGASGKLIFYRDQVADWVRKHQGGQRK